MHTFLEIEDTQLSTVHGGETHLLPNGERDAPLIGGPAPVLPPDFSLPAGGDAVDPRFLPLPGIQHDPRLDDTWPNNIWRLP